MEGQVLSQGSKERGLSRILFTETQQRRDQQFILRASVRIYGQVLVGKDTRTVPVFSQIAPTDNSHPQTGKRLRRSRQETRQHTRIARTEARTDSLSATSVHATGSESSRIIPAADVRCAEQGFRVSPRVLADRTDLRSIGQGSDRFLHCRDRGDETCSEGDWKYRLLQATERRLR